MSPLQQHDPRDLAHPDCLLPGEGKIVVTVHVDYTEGPLAGSHDTFVRYADPEDYDEEVRLASTLCAGALLDVNDRHLRTLLVDAREERQHVGMAEVKVDGHLLYCESLPDLLDTLERYEERSPRGDWLVGGGF